MLSGYPLRRGGLLLSLTRTHFQKLVSVFRLIFILHLFTNKEDKNAHKASRIKNELLKGLSLNADNGKMLVRIKSQNAIQYKFRLKNSR